MNSGETRALRRRLLAWYDANRRTLPWREKTSPYRTWVSEIMLQQTQVATVIPYYERFLARFPDVAALAKAGEADVLRLWAGLGYYSRARNLHRAAKEVASEHGGRFPSGFEEVLALPGIGRYTAGAILSIAFGKPYPVLDGNVMRVFSRLFLIRGNVKEPATQKEMWRLAADLVDPKGPLAVDNARDRAKGRTPCARPGDWNQALMELGALVCVPEAPRCGDCPLADGCAAKKAGAQDELPETGAKRAPADLRWSCLYVSRGGKVLLWKRDDAERFLPGHWSLPEARHLKVRASGRPLATVRHSITHHRIRLDVHAHDGAPPSSARAVWADAREAEKRLVSSLWIKALCAARAAAR
ncbi:MAG: A/G-specific adenine glycosylase [Elusimicrobia bacterium]|nr:A/G-specific adenine glycosylase [Elusimicrobiota bacterium]